MLNDNWSADRIERWRQIQRKGQLRFVLWNGLLCWGGFMFLIFMVFNHSQRYGELIAVFNHFDMDLLFWNLVLWSMGGILYGFLTWHFVNRSFRRKVARRTEVTSQDS